MDDQYKLIADIALAWQKWNYLPDRAILIQKKQAETTWDFPVNGADESSLPGRSRNLY